MLTPVLLLSVVLALGVGIAVAEFDWAIPATVLLAAWVIFAGLRDLLDKTRHKGLLRGLAALSPSYWGMQLGHLGLAVCAMGVVFSSLGSAERDLRLAPGESMELAGYRFVFEGAAHHEGPNYVSDRGSVRVLDGEREIALLHPEKRLYRVQGTVMTEAGIDAGFTRDLYVALGESLGEGAWAVRVHVKPFVRWIWLGGLLMALGGLLVAFDKRYRTRTRARVGEALAAQENPV
jgi:cytochrome c-type biogenesis protein CcmF